MSNTLWEIAMEKARDEGIREGEARATRAIVADLRATARERSTLPPVHDYAALEVAADRYEAGEHLAAKADGEK